MPRSGGGRWGRWGGALRPAAPISLQRVGMPHAAPPAAAPPPRSRRAELCSPPAPPLPQPPPEPAAPMELEPGPEALLDLSFLTEAERCAIAEVLHRDALLRRAEEGRVRWDPQGRPWAATDAGSAGGGGGPEHRVRWLLSPAWAASPSLIYVPSTSSVSSARSTCPAWFLCPSLIRVSPT